MKDVIVRTAIKEDGQLVEILTDDGDSLTFEYSSSIAEVFPTFIIEKIKAGEAVICVIKNNIWIGYSYLKLEKKQLPISDTKTSVVTAFRVYRVPALIKRNI